MSVTGRTEVAELVLSRGIIDGTVAQPLQTPYQESETAKYLIGTKLIFADGREYRYAKNGAVALTKALMTQGAVSDADLFEQDQTGNFPVVGETTIIVEIGTGLTVGLNKDDLAGGTLMVNKGLGIGDTYQILGSEIGSTDTNMSLVIDSPIRTTWDTTTEITIIPSLWFSSLVQVP